MSNDDKQKSKGTGFFIKPKKRAAGELPSSEPIEVQSEPSPGLGLGLDSTLSAPVATAPETPVVPAHPPSSYASDVIIDDASRTKSVRGIAVLFVFGMIAFGGLLLAVGGVAVAVWSDEISEGLSGAVGSNTQFGGGVDETGLYEKEKTVVKYNPKSKDTAVEAVAGPEPVYFTMKGDLPNTAVEVKCPSGFSKRVNVYNNRATVPDVPPEPCTADIKGAGRAFVKVTAGDSITCQLEGGVALKCK